jgi:hypothetical protein
MNRAVCRCAFLVLAAVVAVGPSRPGPALAEERLDSEAPEAWAMFWAASATSFHGVGTPRSREPWSVDFFLDGALLPELSEEDRTVGFGGTKTEDIDKSPVFVRPGLTIGLPWKLAFSIGYVPPVKLFDVRPHLVALAIERPLVESGPWTVGLRLHSQLGRVRGDFTCPQRVVRFEPGSERNPYGCEAKSNDSAVQRSVGLEVSASHRIARLWDLAPYLSLGANYLNTEFKVHARTFGFDDRTHLGADTFTFALGAGATIPVGERLELGLGLHYVPLWVLRPPRALSRDKDALLQARLEVVWHLR